MYEEIKAEIERRMKDNVAAEERWKTGYYGMAVKEDYELLSFIKSYQQPSEDLEKEISNFIDAVDLRTGGSWCEEDIIECARHFAQWQKEQMIPVTALVNESKDFLSLSTEEYAKIGRRFKGGDDIEIYIKQDKK